MTISKKIILLWLIATASFWSVAQEVPIVTGSRIGRSEAQAALDFHNKVRKEVASPPLEWSADMAAYAQEWANYLATNNNCQMAHRKSLGKDIRSAGENIFWGSASKFSALNASEAWYSEIKDYQYRPISTQNYSKTGHYTQMIWKNSREVGIGVAICKDGAIIIVANYFPPGNYIGEKPY